MDLIVFGGAGAGCAGSVTTNGAPAMRDDESTGSAAATARGTTVSVSLDVLPAGMIVGAVRDGTMLDASFTRSSAASRAAIAVCRMTLLTGAAVCAAKI